MRTTTKAGVLAVVLCLLGSLHVLAQQANTTIDAQTRDAVIDSVITYLNEGYVFPEKAKEIEQALRRRQSEGEYDPIRTGSALADSLTAHLRQVTQDRHLGVLYNAEAIPEGRSAAAQQREHLDREQSENFGFSKVERLRGNVGYLELRFFSGLEAAREAATAAMTSLADTDALIIDLRRNGGGSPRMIVQLSSYLFGSESVHLNTFYWRPEDRTEEFWTDPNIAGATFGPDKPVYVLNSRRTFSAAEEFGYNLKHLGRATIVGEPTGGGAHPGGARRINSHFRVWIPRGRAMNPVTKTNWEGTGVQPDVEVPAEQALETAHLMALEQIEELRGEKGSTPNR